MWEVHALLDAAADGLRREEARLTRAQEVHGLDSRDETSLHPVLATGLRRAGFGVLLEQPYPGQTASPSGRRKRAIRAERERCDLVVLPLGVRALIDPVEVLVERDAAEQTLFAQTPKPAPAGVCAEEAYWIEVKATGQFEPVDGVPVPNRAYASVASRCVADLRKLTADPCIGSAGVLLVLFTTERAAAEHDAQMIAHRCLDKGVGVRAPVLCSFEIPDRIGNGWCTLAMFERPV